MMMMTVMVVMVMAVLCIALWRSLVVVVVVAVMVVAVVAVVASPSCRARLPVAVALVGTWAVARADCAWLSGANNKGTSGCGERLRGRRHDSSRHCEKLAITGEWWCLLLCAYTDKLCTR